MEAESVETNVEVVMATDIEQADGDEGTVYTEMSVDDADEYELLDSDIDEEDINPDKEELDQAAEEVDQLDQDDKNSDEPVQEADKSLTTDTQVDADTAIKDSTKTVNENKTNDLPEKEIQMKSLNGVTAEEQTPERTEFRQGLLIVYPVTEDDLEGPLNPVLSLASFVISRFRGSRGRSKQGVLNMRYNMIRNRTSKDESLKLLTGVKLRGGIQPKVIDCSEYTNFNKLDELDSALDSLTGNKATEEQPVSVFVNNIPLDICVEMLHFLYPSAGNIQLPVNSQSAVQGYAIIEFPNLNEAKTVVKNNRAYPAQIGGKYLNMYVIGHEGETDKPEPQMDKVEKKRTNERSSKSPERSQKRSLSEYKSSNPKRSRQDDDKRGSPSTTSSGSATKTQSRTVSDNEKPIEDKTGKFDVCFGDVPNCRPAELLNFIKKEFRQRGLCKMDENPVKKMRFDKNRNFQYAEFSNLSHAEAAIKELQGAMFKGSSLTTKTVTGHSNSGDARRPLDQVKCFRCGEMGHYSTNCQKKGSLDHIKCHKCGEMGHYAKKCPEVLSSCLIPKSDLPTSDPVARAVAQAAAQSLASIMCRNCLETGHILAKCPNTPNLTTSIPNVTADHLSSTKETSNKCSSNEEESIEDKRGKFDVCFENVPNCKPAELLNFIKKEFRQRGLCEMDENPVKKMRFDKNRKFQYAEFSNLSHAEAAIEELQGAIFKGSPLTTKADHLFCTKETCNNCSSIEECPFRLVKVKGDRTIKRVVCKHWLKDQCQRGDDCTFLHEYDMSKVPECKFFSKFGACSKKECAFLHTGLCSNKECPFLHIDPGTKIKGCPCPKSDQPTSDPVTCGEMGHYAKECPNDHLAFLSSS